MRIELPERMPCRNYEFIGGCLLQREQWPSGAQRGDAKLIARLDRGEVLEIGYTVEDEARARHLQIPLSELDIGEAVCVCNIQPDGLRHTIKCEVHDVTLHWAEATAVNKSIVD